MKKQKASQPPHLIGLLGSKWGLLITHTLGTNTLRFTELKKALPQPTQKDAPIAPKKPAKPKKKRTNKKSDDDELSAMKSVS